MAMIRRAWDALPSSLQELLLVGSVGWRQLHEAARRATALQPGSVPGGLARELLRAAWENAPLEGPLAALLPAAEGPCPQLVATAWSEPCQADLRRRMERSKNADPHKAFALAAEGCKAEPDNLFWARQLEQLGMETGRGDEALERITRMPPFHRHEAAPLLAFLQAERHFAEGDWCRAEKAYDNCMRHASWLLPAERRAEALWRMDEHDAALELWREVLLARPWHTNLLQRVHAAIQPLPNVHVMPPTAVLLHTRDNVHRLAETLDDLAASHGLSLVVVLDNGSCDATASLLDIWKRNLGQEALHVEQAPRGMDPATARNMLIELPLLAEMEFVALVDDDLRLPEDWLVKLHAARELYPEAASWGCSLHAPGNPELLLATDLHIRPQHGEEADERQEFRLSELHSQVPGRGQFRSVRPCLSTASCCRLYSLQDLRIWGGFAPLPAAGELANLERDLRRAMQGHFCCHQGGLRVSHQKVSGCGTKSTNGVQEASSWSAIARSLTRKFDPEELRRLQAAQMLLHWQDLSEKIQDVEQGLGLARD
jgi:hypothetical protein